MSVTARFIVTGLIGAVVYFCACYLLLYFPLPTLLVGALAYAVAFPVAYLLHHSWSFEGVASHKSALPRYVLLQALSLGFSSLMVYLVTRATWLDRLTVSALATVLAGAFNYVAARFWVFQDDRDQ